MKLQDQPIDYSGNFSVPDNPIYKSPKGLSRKVVEEISRQKNEPEWMLNFRLKALEIFESKAMPKWGPDLSVIDFSNIHYYLRTTDKPVRNWDEVPDEVKSTFDRLGIPEAERKFLAGAGAQFDSEAVYHNLNEKLEKQGVIFMDMDTAVREHPELVRTYFGTVIPSVDNKFAALNSAVWSGGSFIYVPKGVHVELPLQAYFRINARNMGQFERTLIIADEGSSVHYLEGCSAPTYSTDSLHSAVVEILVRPQANVQYTTIQNWSKNVYNLVTKRAIAQKGAQMFWLDCNLGSKITMKYPAVFLTGEGAKGKVLSLALANDGQHQDAGAKMIHAAPNTTSTIISKSISKGTGRTSYRGLVKVLPNATGAKSHVKCDALLIDSASRSDTYPTLDVHEDDAEVAHEATVTKIGEEQLFYLMSRGLTEAEANSLVVNGFLKDIVMTLPMEYAIEMNRLVELEMEGAVG